MTRVAGPWCRIAVVVLTAVLAAGTAWAQSCPPAAPGQATPACQEPALDKDLAKELARGIFFDALVGKGKFPKKAYAPPPALLKPYADASVGPVVALEMVKGSDFVSAPAAQAMAQQIVDRLLRGIPEASRPAISVYIVAKPEYGAQARESGVILLSLGALNGSKTPAQSEEELALLLAHEISHIVLGHVSDGGFPDVAAKVMSSLSTGLVYYSAFKDARFVNGKLQGEGDKKLMMRTLVSGLASSTMIQDLLTPSYDRKLELEADRLGIDLVKRAGYALSSYEVAKFIGSHGESSLRHSQRLQTLQVVLNAIIASAAPSVSKEIGDKRNIAGTLMAAFGQEITGALASAIVKATRSHPKTEERIVFTTSYFKANYPNAMVDAQGNRLQRSVGTLAPVAASPAMATLANDVREAWAFRDKAESLITTTAVAVAPGAQDMQYEALFKDAGLKIRPADRPAAAAAAPPARARKATARRAVATQPAGPPPRRGFGNDAAALTLLAEGIVWVGNGDRTAAQASWRRGLRSDFASVDMARILSDSLPADPASLAEYDTIVARSKRVFGTTDPVLDVVVASAMARGDAAAAEVAAARCVTYEDGRIYGSCAARLGYNPLSPSQPAKTPEGHLAFNRAQVKQKGKLLLGLGGLFK